MEGNLTMDVKSMNMKDIEKRIINDLMSKKEKIIEILSAKTPEEVRKIFESAGLKITDKQLQKFRQAFLDNISEEVNKLPPEERKELVEKVTDEELEQLSGGRNFDLLNVVDGFMGGLGVGTVVGLISGTLVAAATVVDNTESDQDSREKKDNRWGIAKKALINAAKTTFAIAGTGTVTGGVIGVASEMSSYSSK